MSEVSQELLEMCDRMPAFPASVQRVLALTADLNSAPKQLVKVIDHDPILTMRILKVANSAYFGLSKPIVSIQHAVVYLGLNTVKHVALAIAAIGSLPRENQAGFDMDDFLVHSLVSAVITRSLARKLRIREIDSGNYFVAGLVHDIGQVVFAQFKPKEFRTVLARVQNDETPLYIAEEEELGATHSELGAVLGELWKFPEPLVNAIRMHHVPGQGEQSDPIRNCLFVGNLLSARFHKPINSPPAMSEDDLPPWVFRAFGNDFDTILSDLKDLDTDIAHATSLLQLG